MEKESVHKDEERRRGNRKGIIVSVRWVLPAFLFVICFTPVPCTIDISPLSRPPLIDFFDFAGTDLSPNRYGYSGRENSNNKIISLIIIIIIIFSLFVRLLDTFLSASLRTASTHRALGLPEYRGSPSHENTRQKIYIYIATPLHDTHTAATPIPPHITTPLAGPVPRHLDTYFSPFDPAGGFTMRSTTLRATRCFTGRTSTNNTIHMAALLLRAHPFSTSTAAAVNRLRRLGLAAPTVTGLLLLKRLGATTATVHSAHCFSSNSNSNGGSNHPPTSPMDSSSPATPPYPSWGEPPTAEAFAAPPPSAYMDFGDADGGAASKQHSSGPNAKAAPSSAAFEFPAEGTTENAGSSPPGLAPSSSAGSSEGLEPGDKDTKIKKQSPPTYSAAAYSPSHRANRLDSNRSPLATQHFDTQDVDADMLTHDYWTNANDVARAAGPGAAYRFDEEFGGENSPTPYQHLSRALLDDLLPDELLYEPSEVFIDDKDKTNNSYRLLSLTLCLEQEFLTSFTVRGGGGGAGEAALRLCVGVPSHAERWASFSYIRIQTQTRNYSHNGIRFVGGGVGQRPHSSWVILMSTC
eukprot:gene11624-8012_t